MPLPYSIPASKQISTRVSTEQHAAQVDKQSGSDPGLQRLTTGRSTIAPSQTYTSSLDLEAASRSSPRVRKRSVSNVDDRPPLARGLTRVGTIMHAAHAQDFERKKKVPLISGGASGRTVEEEESDEDDEQHEGDMLSSSSRASGHEDCEAVEEVADEVREEYEMSGASGEEGEASASQ